MIDVVTGAALLALSVCLTLLLAVPVHLLGRSVLARIARQKKDAQ